MRVRGVDFSGAAEPGELLWIAEGETGGDGFVVDRCVPAATAFGATDRAAVLAALREWLAGSDAVTGLDLSFGLPRALLPPLDSWTAFLEWFGAAFADADGRSMATALRERARASDADGVDLTRRTDGPTGASSPYSVFTRYGTLHGIRDVLAPLVAADRIGVEPMAPAPDGEARPTAIEVYPAGTLRELGLPDERYKGDHPDAPGRRGRILDGLEARGVDIPGTARERALADDGGDALDGLVAAVATARALDREFAVDRDR